MAAYRRFARRLACENSLFRVYFDSLRSSSGEEVPRFLIIRPKIATRDGIVGVCILPELRGRIGLMRGYRHQFRRQLWQAPAGFIDPGETSRRAALRELEEETGLTCAPRDLVSLGDYAPDAGLIEGRVALFVARNCRSLAKRRPAATEVGAGRLVFFDLRRLKALALRERWVGGSTLIACLRLLMR